MQTPPRYPFMEVSLACSDCAAMEAFWIKMFDAEVLFRGAIMGEPFTRLMVCGISLLFRQDPAFVAPPGPGQERLYRNHLGLRCGDLDAALTDLEARGAQFVLSPAIVRQLQARQVADGEDRQRQHAQRHDAREPDGQVAQVLDPEAD